VSKSSCGQTGKRLGRIPPIAALLGSYREAAIARVRDEDAHLLEPNPRTPRKWLPLARSHLRGAGACTWFRPR
jgi:hypothetical protein